MTATYVAIDTLKPSARNARTHSRKQIGQISESIKAFGFLVPVLIDENQTILAGHGRLAAAKLLGMTEIPVIRVEGLTPAKKRAFMLADNKLAENAGWDRNVLAVEFPELAELLVEDGLEISITGFAPVEVDQIMVDFENDNSSPADDVDEGLRSPPPGKPAGRCVAARPTPPLVR